MRDKKVDTKLIVGIVIIGVVLILGIIFFLLKDNKTNFDSSVNLPQVEGGSITTQQLDAPISVNSFKNKENETNQNQDETRPIQKITKSNGLVIEILREGSGVSVKSGDTISVDYVGYLTDGTIFDESYKRGQKFSFVVGEGMVIPGWEEGVLGAKKGEKRRLTIPGELGYGSRGIPGLIPANATLVFEIEVHTIN